MKKLFTLIALTAAACVDGHGSNEQGIESLYGTWAVVGNSVAPSNVQAYTENDPRLVGARLNISDSRAVWSGRDSFTEWPCEVSEISYYPPRQFDIICNEGYGLAPKTSVPSMHIDSSGVLRINWYDGANLKLENVARAQ